MQAGHGAPADSLSLVWALPFGGLLLSIAILPLVARHAWERWFGAVTALWAMLFLLPYALHAGPAAAAEAVLGTAAHEYLPFIFLLLSLFVVAGNIQVAGNLIGTPGTNFTILGLGTLAASLLGTTGASMLLIRPLIRANQDRRRNAHVFVFFIFLVGNIGGALTPLGDPPLFLGFLRGVDFGWTTVALSPPMGLAAGLLLGMFFLIDLYHWNREGADWAKSRVPRQLRIEGWHNFIYLATIIGAVLASGIWQSHIALKLGFGVEVMLEDAARDAALPIIAFASWHSTRPQIRIENAFAWTPIQEVGILFAGIFVTIIPVLDALRLGPSGPFGPLLALVTRPDGMPIDWAYFWLTGGLSSVLDNAPTYLVFFDLAGGDPGRLTGPLARTLLAISTGAVFMGANTYLGNAPNFMIKAICEERGIRMPGFFAYLVWSGSILLPLFVLLTLVFFR